MKKILVETSKFKTINTDYVTRFKASEKGSISKETVDNIVKDLGLDERERAILEVKVNKFNDSSASYSSVKFKR